MAAFDLALAHVRHGAENLLVSDRVSQLARDRGVQFRNTPLNPGRTLRLFVQQIANGNIACSAVHYLAGEEFSDTAWCQARKRLPQDLIREVHRQVVEEARRDLDHSDNVGDGASGWHGHRTFIVDGSSDSMPDAPELRDHYGVPLPCREGLGFPMSHLLLLMEHRSGLFIDCVDSPMYSSDMSQTPAMHGHLRQGDVLLGDDSFAGWAHFALLLRAKLHAVTPAHHSRHVDFTPGRAHAHPRGGKASQRVGKPSSRLVKTLGYQDQLVECFKPAQKPAWMSQGQWDQLPESILLREIRRTISRHGFRPLTVTIVTTLLDAQQYPADELIELRLTRWMIETNLRHLKITLGMDVLKCKTLVGVRKERMIFLLVYNLIRILMLQAARRQGVNVNRLSFADALAWLRWGDLNTPPALKVNPWRPGRLEPRTLKRAKKQFPYLTVPRKQRKAELVGEYKDAP